jgi:hypothetical protein
VEVYVRDVEVYVPDVEVYLGDVEVYVRDVEVYVRDVEAYLRDVEAYVRDVEVYLRDVQAYVRKVKPTSCDMRTGRFINLRSRLGQPSTGHGPPSPVLGLAFLYLAQNTVHSGCGCLRKTARNVTAKRLALSRVRTHLGATSTLMLRRRCQGVGVVSMKRRISETTVSARMRCRRCQRVGGVAAVKRWVTVATGSARMLCRRCQRAEHGPQ